MFEPVAPRAERCRVVYVSPLKALAVDIERNLRAPIQGIAAVAEQRGEAVHLPDVAIRTGDTPAAARARMARRPPDILITTPESLYLVLTARARETLASVETVIVDEIHALVGTKRGAHLALSLERLEEIAGRPVQRVGLSATQRPLEEVARYLGGGSGEQPWSPRAVTLVDAGAKKSFDLRVEVPVEDMSRLGDDAESVAGEAPEGPAGLPARRSIWPAIQPRLLELVRAHRSTIVFVNSRRLAERLAAALNDLAGEPVARAHHGSVAREQRLEIEDALKAGRLPALVATSSLELGIDMGAVDLVVQIETPTSVSSGIQRIGRASHQVEAVSRGVIFPKYRGDLLASAAITQAMKQGAVEETRVPHEPPRRSRSAAGGDGGAGRTHGRRSLRPGPAGDAVRGPAPGAIRGRPRHALRALPLRRVRRAPAAAGVGPAAGDACGPATAPSAWRSPTPARSPTGASTESSSPRAKVPAAEWGSSTRRWFSRAGWARSSFSGPRAGGSRRSPGTGSSCSRPRGSRARCRSGERTAGRGRWSWAGPSGGSPVSWRRGRGSRRRLCSATTTTWTPAPRRTSSATSRSSRRPPGLCPTTAPSSWSAAATRWGTGGCASWVRGAGGSTPRGPWLSRPGCVAGARPRSRPFGATTGSCFVSPSANGPPKPPTSCPSPRRSRTSWCRSSGARVCSLLTSARRRPGRCSFPVADPGNGPPSGCRGKRPTTC